MAKHFPTTERALYAAVCAVPWDDLARLAYADWLEENGDADRALFIRSQIELFGLTSGHPRVTELHARLGPLHEKYALGWQGRLPALPGVRWLDSALRGFPFHATVLHPKAFREQADRLFAAAPVQSLAVHRLTPRTVREVAASAYLSRLSSLTLTGRLGDEGVTALLASPHLHRLENLTLRGNRTTDEGAAALAAADTIPNVTWLDLDDNDVGDAGALALAASPRLRKVKHLRWADNPIGPAAEQALERRFGDRYSHIREMLDKAHIW
jgi:uncharacterized protein (TIGR02996 family)